jgi:NIPSNAP protein
MKTILATLLCALSITLLFATTALAEDTRLFELRVYFAAAGKLDDLNARFRNHTTALFEKHGMENIGYWVPTDNQSNKLVYILAYPSKEAREASWKEFMADPEWKQVVKESEANGKLVNKVESTFMRATDYSPAIKPSKAEPARVFELRIYTTQEGRLPNLDKRFRDHTVKLFEKHGMTNFGYWTPTDKPNTLIYLLAHKSQAAAKASFAAFGADPDWQTARKASEAEAGGSLTIADGVKSEFLAPTDYSPTK